jgi:hypothetical protein
MKSSLLFIALFGAQLYVDGFNIQNNALFGGYVARKQAVDSNVCKKLPTFRPRNCARRGIVVHASTTDVDGAVPMTATPAHKLEDYSSQVIMFPTRVHSMHRLVRGCLDAGIWGTNFVLLMVVLFFLGQNNVCFDHCCLNTHARTHELVLHMAVSFWSCITVPWCCFDHCCQNRHAHITCTHTYMHTHTYTHTQTHTHIQTYTHANTHIV